MPQTLALTILIPVGGTHYSPETVHGFNTHLDGIGLVGTPVCQSVAIRVFVTLAILLVLVPGFFQVGTCGAHLLVRLGDTQNRRNGFFYRCTGVGTDTVLSQLLVYIDHALGNTQAHGGETTGKVGTVRRVEDLAVRVQRTTGMTAFHHVTSGLNAVFGNEHALDAGGFGAAALHADRVPVVNDGEVALGDNRKAVHLLTGVVKAVEADNDPLGMVNTGAPLHVAGKDDAAFCFFMLAEGGD